MSTPSILCVCQLMLIVCLANGRIYAQDKPNRLRAFYKLPKDYRVRYLQKVPASAFVETKRVVSRKLNSTGRIVSEETTEMSTTTTPRSGAIQFSENGTKKVAIKKVAVAVKQKGDSLFYVVKGKFNPDNPASDVINNTNTTAGKYFEVVGEATGAGTAGDFITVPYRALEFGVVAIPFRAYLANGDRSYLPSVSSGVGFFIGPNYGRTRFYRGGIAKNFSFIPALYIAGSNINITKGNIRSGTTIDDKSSEPALTGGIALLFGKDDLTFGTVLGRDFPLTPTGRQWVYSKAAYIGVIASLQVAAFK